MQARIGNLENEVADLKAMIRQLQAPASLSIAAASSGAATAGPLETGSISNPQAVRQDQQNKSPDQQNTLPAEDRKTLNFLRGTTIDVGLDGYYAYNFNHPVGRVNALRAYDVLSNELSLNQADVILDHPADVSAGHRWGGRLDLQFGQATDTLQGNALNEPRPEIYRNVFQAYGTYVAPIGKGLAIDFGKWGSSIGIEGNYSKDQVNYSRAFWFDFLPFYHMGLRISYPVSDRFSLNYWVVNGTNQVEATNGFKDELFGFNFKPRKNVTWTMNYYLGQEHPDRVVVAATSPIPVQPGLSFEAIRPAPNGRTHIFDSYVTWQATPKLSVSLEGDYFIQRLWKDQALGESAAPSHVAGGAAYLRSTYSEIRAGDPRGIPFRSRRPIQRPHASAEGKHRDAGLRDGGRIPDALRMAARLFQSAVLSFRRARGFEQRAEHRHRWAGVVVGTQRRSVVAGDAKAGRR
jgi:Putative beta-barrel porin-2, OmpL-like. bbp2